MKVLRESLLVDEDTGSGAVRHSSWVTCLQIVVVRRRTPSRYPRHCTVTLSFLNYLGRILVVSEEIQDEVTPVSQRGDYFVCPVSPCPVSPSEGDLENRRLGLPATVRVFHLCRAKGLCSICIDHRGHMLRDLNVMPGTGLAHMLEQNAQDFA